VDKRKILDNLKRRKFSQDCYSIINLFEKHLNKIEFVKDHIKLDNFVFLSEIEATLFDTPYYACFEFEWVENETSSDFPSAKQYFIYDGNEIYKHVKRFLENSNSKLYVEIGFVESFISQEDNFKIYYLLKNKEETNIERAIAKTKRFPDWYTANSSNDIEETTLLWRELEQQEIALNKHLKIEMLKEIDKAICESDEKKFSKLTKSYIKICRGDN
jgi:hypothetical protein